MKHLWREAGLGANRKKERKKERGKERKKKREMSGEAAGRKEGRKGGRNCRIRDKRECIRIDKYINKASLANEQSSRGNSDML